MISSLNFPTLSPPFFFLSEHPSIRAGRIRTSRNPIQEAKKRQTNIGTKTTHLRISTCSISPEKEKNS